MTAKSDRDLEHEMMQDIIEMGRQIDWLKRDNTRLWVMVSVSWIGVLASLLSILWLHFWGGP